MTSRKNKQNLSTIGVENFDPSQIQRFNSYQMTIGFNILKVGLAIWTLVEAFKTNYFANENLGSKILSIVLIAVSSLVFLFSTGVMGVLHGKISEKFLLPFLLSALFVFFNLVFLLNVWKINGVIVEKETESALTFIKFWAFLTLALALFGIFMYARPIVKGR